MYATLSEVIAMVTSVLHRGGEGLPPRSECISKVPQGGVKHQDRWLHVVHRIPVDNAPCKHGMIRALGVPKSTFGAPSSVLLKIACSMTPKTHVGQVMMVQDNKCPVACLPEHLSLRIACLERLGLRHETNHDQ